MGKTVSKAIRFADQNPTDIKTDKQEQQESSISFNNKLEKQVESTRHGNPKFDQISQRNPDEPRLKQMATRVGRPAERNVRSTNGWKRDSSKKAKKDDRKPKIVCKVGRVYPIGVKNFGEKR